MKTGYFTKGLCLILSICFLIVVSPFSAQAISLKENSVVTEEVIKLGDLFHGLKHNTDRVLGVAPRPGTEMVLNARTLMRIAVALDLPWRPATSADYIVIRRAATIIDRPAIENALQTAIAEKRDDNNQFRILIPNGMDEMILPQDMPKSIDVSYVNIRDDGRYFEAQLVAPSKDKPYKTMRVSGTIEKMIDVPVLRKTLRTGDIIGKHDLDTIQIREQDLQHNFILSSDDLVGLTPRRMVLEGKPIQTSDVESPVMVERGDLITMTFTEGPLVLSAKGKALQDGALGDYIRVVNLSSNKTIEAVVSGTREVAVKAF